MNLSNDILVVTTGVNDDNIDIKHVLYFPSVFWEYYDKIYDSCVKQNTRIEMNTNTLFCLIFPSLPRITTS